MFTNIRRLVGGTAVAVLGLGLAGTAWAGGPGHAGLAHGGPAQMRPINPVNPGNRPGYRPDAQHMPGWDWKYLYPQVYYSTHGYWPYTPYRPVVPYYVPSYLPYGGTVLPAFQPQVINYGTVPAAAPVPAPQDPALAPAPFPINPYREPTANTAVIVVRLPDGAATVSFDGQLIAGQGNNRRYGTPWLKAGQTYSYTVTAAGAAQGQAETRTIDVTPGRITLVDFTRPATR